MTLEKGVHSRLSSEAVFYSQAGKELVRGSFLARCELHNDCPLYLAGNELVLGLTKNTDSDLW